jgi:chemotaxis protein methyltransferase CheR
MTNNETWFFRDFNPFEALRNLIIPNLIKKRSSERKIVIWSAACSTGQEPYSIALLLREHFNLPGWRFVVHATDLAATVLAKAKSGRYLQHEVNRGLPAPLLVKHFTRVGLEWEVKKEIRDCVDFRLLNLTKPWKDVPPPDVIFLRNVMIYFDLEIRRQILARAHDILRPEGYLFLGGAETTFNLDKRFERMELEKTSCYQIKK